MPFILARRLAAPRQQGSHKLDLLVTGSRIAFIVLLFGFALATPGFLSRLSLMSMISTMSFVGCVAVAMTFITMSGNVISLALGSTFSATAVVFMASTGLGLPGAVALAMLFGIAVTGVQGFIIGYFRANGILVSIAVYALIVGITDLMTGGHRIYPGDEGYSVLTGRLAGIPIEIVMFVTVALIGQTILSFTGIGQTIIAVGSSRPAAVAAALAPAKAITWTYVWAGAFTAVSGILFACRYGSGSMEMGDGYDYIAIAAVLVGGNSIRGGAGSVGRTVIGLLIISTIEVVLLLRGFSAEMQHFVSGLMVLGVIALGAVRERAS